MVQDPLHAVQPAIPDGSEVQTSEIVGLHFPQKVFVSAAFNIQFLISKGDEMDLARHRSFSIGTKTMKTIETLLAKIEKMQFPPSLRTQRIERLRRRKSFVRLSEEIKIYTRLFLKEGKLTATQRQNLCRWREELAFARVQVPRKQRSYFDLLAKIVDEINVELARSSAEQK